MLNKDLHPLLSNLPFNLIDSANVPKNKNYCYEPWLVWLSWLECCAVHQEVGYSIPSQGTNLGCSFNSQSRYIWEATNQCFSHQHFSLSLSLLLSLKSINILKYNCCEQFRLLLKDVVLRNKMCLKSVFQQWNIHITKLTIYSKTAIILFQRQTAFWRGEGVASCLNWIKFKHQINM